MSSLAVTLYGVCVLTFMMVMYALEGRHSIFVLAFALWVPALERIRLPLRCVAIRRRRVDLVGRRRTPAVEYLKSFQGAFPTHRG